MPKINWAGDDPDEALTADDIENAEDGYQAYTGPIPPGGVYRFKTRRMKFAKANTGTKGINVLMVLDGSWKSSHAKFDGCPLWDTVWMTRGSAPFVKAFARAIGVSAADIVGAVVTDDDGYITKIGRKNIREGQVLYVAVREGEYNDQPRLEKAGTGFQVVEDSDDDAAEEAPAKATKATAAKATAAKATKGAAKATPAKEAKPAGKSKKNKSKNDDDGPPF